LIDGRAALLDDEKPRTREEVEELDARVADVQGRLRDLGLRSADLPP
jgi:hypothetical protein